MLFGRAILPLTPIWEQEKAIVLAPSLVANRLCREEGCQELTVRESLWQFDLMDRRSSWDIRQFVSEARLSEAPLSEANDLEVVAMVRTAIETHALIALRKSDKTEKAGDATAEQRRLVGQIDKQTRGGLNFSGRSYRLVADVDLAVVPGRSSYDVVGRDEARQVLHSLVKESSTPGELATLLRQARAKLTADWRPPFNPDGLILLRRIIVRAATITSDEPAITPSQLKQKLEPSGVIEIELVDEQGKPVPGEAWELLLPDGSKHSGQLDNTGYVKLTSIPDGTCQVRFPRLDGDAWEPCS